MSELKIKEIRKLLKDLGLDDTLIIGYKSAREVLTEKRIELIKKIEEEEIESIRDLSRKVDRGESVVFNDLVLLAENGIIDFKKEKNRKIPVLRHSNIFVKPIRLKNEVLFDGTD